jgi:hypothetical protein
MEGSLKMEGSTLKELNVQPGDVVQFGTDNEKYQIAYHNGMLCAMDGCFVVRVVDKSVARKWCIVSRAPETPKLWRDMTDSEKGALLLAQHEGKVIECEQRPSGVWLAIAYCGFNDDDSSYRVRPEPKRDTVTLYGRNTWNAHYNKDRAPLDTHRITFDLIDGHPDTASIKMEAL